MVKKKEGFDGQKAIVIPRTILGNYCVCSNLIKELYITDIGYYPKAKHHYRERPKGADQHILIYCMEGLGSAVIDGKQYEILPGDFILIPAGTPHVYQANHQNPWTIHWVHFLGLHALEMVEQFFNQHNEYKSSTLIQQSRVLLFEDIYANLEMGYSQDSLCYSNLCFKHYLASFIYKEHFNRYAKRPAEDAIELSIEFMKSHIDQLLTLEDLAREVHLSSSHYSFLFRKKTGFSPIDHFNHLKVQKACQFLLFTDLRVKEIADKLGIMDPYYFSRMFSKIMGMSPATYRIKKIS